MYNKGTVNKLQIISQIIEKLAERRAEGAPLIKSQNFKCDILSCARMHILAQQKILIKMNIILPYFARIFNIYFSQKNEKLAERRAKGAQLIKS